MHNFVMTKDLSDSFTFISGLHSLQVTSYGLGQKDSHLLKWARMVSRVIEKTTATPKPWQEPNCQPTRLLNQGENVAGEIFRRVKINYDLGEAAPIVKVQMDK